MTQTTGRFFDELGKLITDAAGAAQGVRKEIESVVRAQAENILRELDVVQREEFEAAKAMAKLSVNVNKIATVRNSRGGRVPAVIDGVRVCIDAGAPGITVHPRADARHITRDDVFEIAGELAPLRGKVEYNIEGDPRPELIQLVGNGRINPGKVFDLELPLAQVADGYRAMDERRAIKTLLRI